MNHDPPPDPPPHRPLTFGIGSNIWTHLIRLNCQIITMGLDQLYFSSFHFILHKYFRFNLKVGF